MLVYKNTRLRLQLLLQVATPCNMQAWCLASKLQIVCERMFVLCLSMVLTAKSAFGVCVHGHGRHHIHIRLLLSGN